MGKLKAKRFTLGVLGIIMSLLMLVSGGVILPGLANADSTVIIGVDPSSVTAAFNNTFTVDIKVTIMDSENVNAVQACLTFDPTNLEVVGITRGAAISDWYEMPVPGWEDHYWNNTSGQIIYSVYALPTPVMNATFVIATVEFKALAVTTSTPITFVKEGVVKTEVYSATGQSIPVGFQDGEATVKAFTLLGYVNLQGRSTIEGWETPLRVTFLQPGTENKVAIREVTTDNTGNFTVSDAPVGTYDIRVKCSHTLANRKIGVLISEETTSPIDFGTLLEGDANDDNVINIGDVSLLATCFLKLKGQPGFIDDCDFNRDGKVNIGDVSIIGMNFLRYGDIIV